MLYSSQRGVGVYKRFCQLAMVFPVVRVCVTVVGLVQSSFLCLCFRVSGYCCNSCVCRYMWSEFYCAQWLGHLDQLLECFSVFSHPPLTLIIITLLLSLLLLLLRRLNILIYEVKYTLLSIKMMMIIITQLTTRNVTHQLEQRFFAWRFWRSLALLLLLLLFPQSSWLCSTGAWAGAGYGGRGSWLCCGQGRLLGCSCYLGLGSAAPAPRFLGTQPPHATQALT